MNQGARDEPKLLSRPRRAFSDGWFPLPTGKMPMGKILYLTLFPSCFFFSGVVGLSADLRSNGPWGGGGPGYGRWMGGVVYQGCWWRWGLRSAIGHLLLVWIGNMATNRTRTAAITALSTDILAFQDMTFKLLGS